VLRFGLVRRVLLLSGLLLAAVVAAADQKSTPLAVAREEAESNVKSPAGRA